MSQIDTALLVDHCFCSSKMGSW